MTIDFLWCFSLYSLPSCQVFTMVITNSFFIDHFRPPQFYIVLHYLTSLQSCLVQTSNINFRTLPNFNPDKWSLFVPGKPIAYNNLPYHCFNIIGPMYFSVESIILYMVYFLFLYSISKINYNFCNYVGFIIGLFIKFSFQNDLMRLEYGVGINSLWAGMISTSQ